MGEAPIRQVPSREGQFLAGDAGASGAEDRFEIATREAVAGMNPMIGEPMIGEPGIGEAGTSIAGAAFARVRRQSEELCRPLSAEDMMVQSCAEASPAKWHLAHTTWFFETFLLREFLPGYREFDSRFRWLFNSYYNAISDQPEKRLRASFSRPGLEAVFGYRRHVDEGIERLLESNPSPEVLERMALGLNHEQQHQELLATDIKHALWTNPLRSAYARVEAAASLSPTELTAGETPDSLPDRLPDRKFVKYGGGLLDVGFAGGGFAFDNELPRHPEYLQPFALASRLITCAEYLEFMEDGGYRRPELWLAEGWQCVQREGWHAPLYWMSEDGVWRIYTMYGSESLESLAATPVCHVSYFEADAFANWAGMSLPSEAEWEVAAIAAPIEGNLLENGRLHTMVCSSPPGPHPAQLYGDVWEWTRSPYVAYPGFRPMPGALGEYNGKFMSNQMVLRGGSAVTPKSHIRASYRNFFPPATRWQFSGIRLARL